MRKIVLYGQLALERHDHTATKAERIRYSQKWVLSLNAEGKQPPRQLRPVYEEAKRECQRLQDEFMAETGQLYTPIHPSKQRRQNPNQQFVGREEYDYVVDRRTGWKWFQEQPPTDPVSGWESSGSLRLGFNGHRQMPPAGSSLVTDALHVAMGVSTCHISVLEVRRQRVQTT